MGTDRETLMIFVDEMRHQRELWDAEYLGTTAAVCLWALYGIGVFAIIASIVYCSIK